jgi:hypothetical protein
MIAIVALLLGLYLWAESEQTNRSHRNDTCDLSLIRCTWTFDNQRLLDRAATSDIGKSRIKIASWVGTHQHCL